MELTKNEIEIADRCISKREKQLAQWPHRRLFILVIFSVFMLVGYLTAGDGVRSIQNDEATDSDVRRALGEGPPPGEEHIWAVGAMMKISKILELRHQVVTYALMEVAVGSMQVLLGLTMVCLTVLRWNVGEKDALICKLLRGKLQELEQEAAANSRPPSQFPSSPEVQSSVPQRTPSSGGYR